MKQTLKELASFAMVFWVGLTLFILTMRYAEWFYLLVFNGH